MEDLIKSIKNKLLLDNEKVTEGATSKVPEDLNKEEDKKQAMNKVVIDNTDDNDEVKQKVNEVTAKAKLAATSDSDDQKSKLQFNVLSKYQQGVDDEEEGLVIQDDVSFLD